MALRHPNGELIQCKSSGRDGRELGWDAIKDVVTGEAAYRLKYPDITFSKVCVTNQYFNAGAHDQARLNNVILVDQEGLKSLIAEHDVSREEVERLLGGNWSGP